MGISSDIKKDAIIWMKGYYLVHMWELENSDFSEHDRAVLYSYYEEMIDKYESELLVHTLKQEIYEK